MGDLLVRQLEELLSETDDFIANAANFTAFLFDNIDDINWCGFYFDNGKELILSIFQGKTACIRIPYNSGICGYSYTNKQIIVADDVHQFEGHIACDSASNSEMVIPLYYNNTLIAVLDLDSPIFSRFDNDTQQLILNLFSIFKSKTNLNKAVNYYYA